MVEGSAPEGRTSENPQNANFAVLKFYELRHNGVLRSSPGEIQKPSMW